MTTPTPATLTGADGSPIGSSIFPSQFWQHLRGRHPRPASRLGSWAALTGLGERTPPIPTLTQASDTATLILPEKEEAKIKRRRTWHESNCGLSAARELFPSTREGGGSSPFRNEKNETSVATFSITRSARMVHFQNAAFASDLLET